MRCAAMFEKENALPGAEVQLAIDNWHILARPRQDHADMRGHVVRAFIVVLVVRVFWYQLLEKPFHIAPRRRSRVLHHGQAATGVLNENRHDPVSNAGFVDLLLNLIRDLIGAFAVGSDLELAMMNAHRGHGIQSRPDQQGAARSGGFQAAEQLNGGLETAVP
jgi:hypothetical protein